MRTIPLTRGYETIVDDEDRKGDFKMSSHSKGRWFPYGENRNISIGVEDGKTKFCYDIAEVIPVGNLEIQKANANLIAAAPDLLWKLEQAQSILSAGTIIPEFANKLGKEIAELIEQVTGEPVRS